MRGLVLRENWETIAKGFSILDDDYSEGYKHVYIAEWDVKNLRDAMENCAVSKVACIILHISKQVKEKSLHLLLILRLKEHEQHIYHDYSYEKINLHQLNYERDIVTVFSRKFKSCPSRAEINIEIYS